MTTATVAGLLMIAVSIAGLPVGYVAGAIAWASTSSERDRATTRYPGGDVKCCESLQRSGA